MKALTIRPPENFSWLMVITYLSSLACLIPENNIVLSNMLWLIMFLSCAFIFRVSIKKLTFFSIRVKRSESSYNNVIFLSCLHTASFFLACPSFKIRHYISIEYSLLFLATSFICFYSSFYFYVESLGEKKEHIRRLSALAFKVSWFVIPLGSYFISRSIFMSMTDIPYEQIITKVSVFGYAVLLYTMIYIGIAVLFIIVIGLSERVVRNKNQHKKIYSSVIFFLPAMLFWGVVYVYAFSNIYIVMQGIFRVTIPMDTRDTFFCHEKYRAISSLKDARYMKVKDGDYRLALPYNYEYNFFRLECTNYPPFYKIIPIENKWSLNYSSLRKRSFDLIVDLDSIKHQNEY